MPLCQMHKNIEDEVVDFTAHVPSAGEESITDYLFWRWSLVNQKNSHLIARSFTKLEENKTTDADFEMKIWFVGDSYNLSLAIQAKKISSEHERPSHILCNCYLPHINTYTESGMGSII